MIFYNNYSTWCVIVSGIIFILYYEVFRFDFEIFLEIVSFIDFDLVVIISYFLFYPLTRYSEDLFSLTFMFL